MTTDQATAVAGAHLVGGLKAPDAETAMRTAGGILGRHLHAVTDGETGARAQWIFCQIDKLAGIDGIDIVGTHDLHNEYEGIGTVPELAISPSLTALPTGRLGYADDARASYATFRELREQRALPADIKFQVCVPTPYATVITWVRTDEHERFLPIYAAALNAEIAQIADDIPADDLVIQYDVAVEIATITGAFETTERLRDKRFIVDALRTALDAVPDGIERGLHFCYGNYKHRHFTIPEDLALCVELANAAGGRCDFVHMPADRETGRDPRYFEPLRELRDTRLALGVVDYDGDEQRTRELIDAALAGSGGRGFAIATECGMSRMDDREGAEQSLERLLELHAQFATPIR